MIIYKAIKNEPWQVESDWEWIPSKKRNNPYFKSKSVVKKTPKKLKWKSKK